MKQKHIYTTITIFSLLLLTSCKNEPKITKYPTIGYLEKLHPKFDKIIPSTTKIEIIDSDYVWSEGPVWLAEEQALIFSDVPQNIAYRWTPQAGTTTYLSPSGYSGTKNNQQGSNGLFLDKNGDLILCQTGNRMVARIASPLNAPQSIFDTLAHQYNGQRFNAPNDLAIDNQNNIYFTDPNFGLEMSEKEIPFQGVYKINPQGEVQLLTDKHPTPNGIGLSPDASKLYIANSEPAYFVQYDLADNGTLSNEKILLDLETLWQNSIAKQRPDGMAIRKDGIIFLTGPDGVLVIEPDGTHLGTIRTDKLTANCTFNEDESVLYVTCHELILRVQLK